MFRLNIQTIDIFVHQNVLENTYLYQIYCSNNMYQGSIFFTGLPTISEKGEEGIKNRENLADVINGWSFFESTHCPTFPTFSENAPIRLALQPVLSVTTHFMEPPGMKDLYQVQ